MYDGRFLATDSLRLNPTMRGVTTDSPSPNILSGRNDTTVPSDSADSLTRSKRFKSPPAEVKESQGGTVEGEMETKPVTVRLASPDSWMRNREIRPPVSPCVPHTFSPVWRRSALAYPEYNLPSELKIDEKTNEVERMNGVEASSSASDSTLFGRFTARQASFMAAISGYDRRHLEVDEKRTAEESTHF
uniref:Uncharacterized protein n=1 Tax=Parascaris equorum TaxID=6256 RepID=A0A914RA83_PAREQ